MKKLVLIFVLLLASFISDAQNLKLSSMFSNGAVLQQKSSVNVWGWAKPSAAITVTPSWGTPVKAVTSASGEWFVKIKTPSGSYKSQTLTVESGKDKIVLSDILIGEVWLASGQSNMEMTFYENPLNTMRVEGASGVVGGDADKYLRSFNVARSEKFYPQADITPNGGWKSKNEKDVVWFSAVGYFFGAKLREALNIPVGIINSSYGGTPVESWIPDKYTASALFDTKRGERKEEIRLNELGHEAAISRFSEWIKKSQGADSYTFATAAYKNLPELDLPNYFYNTPRGESLGGTFIYKTVTVDEPLELTLELPQIDRNCQIFFNGKLIYQAILPSEAYRHPKVKIPSSMVAAGENVIAINMITTLWNGGIVGDASEMSLKSASGKVIPLAGKWHFLKTFELSGVDPVPGEGLPTAFLLSSLYNGMIDPLKYYGVKGFLWYQGESNISNGEQYPEMLQNLVKGWRDSWGADLPFYYVQIAPWKYSGHNNTEAARLRSLMSSAYKKIPGTGVILTGDLGDSLNIHPAKKREVGERLAIKALSETYGKSAYAIKYPSAEKISLASGRILLKIAGTYGKIIVKPGVSRFEISEDGENFTRCDFRIRGNEIIIDCGNIKAPKYLRFAYSNSASVNVFNAKMLPLDLFNIVL